MKRAWIMKRARIGMAAALACCMALAGCGSQSTQSGSQGEVMRLSSRGTNGKEGTVLAQNRGDAESAYPAADRLDATLAETTNRFAYQFAQELGGSGENYFFSPYSICSALAVLDNAARGETKAQIEEMLGITDLDHYNRQIGYYMRQPQNKRASLSSANSLWLQTGYALSETAYTDYLPLVESYYNAEIWEADFQNNPSGTKEAVNAWVKERTGEMIPAFRKEDYSRDTVLSIINAVYFYGEWSVPFLAAKTREQDFHGGHGDTVVPMMHNGEIYLPYYVQGDLRGLSMPYGDKSKVMNILLPAEEASQSASELFAALSDGEKNDFLTTLMNSDEVMVSSLRIPKFQMEYSVPQMKQILQQLGMVDAFGAEADFGGLADADLYVSEVSHTAKLEVDELGSRASAVTEIVVAKNSMMIEEGSIQFIVDQPFVFFIQDKETGMILFMGEVKDL